MTLMALMKTIKVIMAIKVKFTHLFICNLDLDGPDDPDELSP